MDEFTGRSLAKLEVAPRDSEFFRRSGIFKGLIRPFSAMEYPDNASKPSEPLGNVGKSCTTSSLSDGISGVCLITALSNLTVFVMPDYEREGITVDRFLDLSTVSSLFLGIGS
ncbi:uncharacterized protein LY79DRAFT_656358 [Colletotrichum navitas]|uniref:Uncharacterized protein n=1 Tax=Colletotrichum navitas TaxID=681940 RepID=A0AAD8Q874_9PEZI|nr:uncharacterized protein LY79DRAFT_656358 [Colletotrichum navitas]KAK1597580.1 hypothetical protein LY79DRAFT_656358 [Colletotrichum navitas]